MKPVIIVNFKNYKQSMGKNSLKLAKICKDVSKKFGIKIIVAPQYTDLQQVSKEIKIPVMSQHVDAIEYGKHTGRISPAAVKNVGAVGTFINHSEKKLPLNEIRKTIAICKTHKLTTVCFAQNFNAAIKIAKFKPDYLAYEPPELVGGGRSVSKVKPRTISEIVSAVKKIDPKLKILVGAGITNADDVKKSFELGSEGVLVASGFVLAKNPKKALTSFAEVAKNLIIRK